jgi:hypothetical protein
MSTNLYLNGVAGLFSSESMSFIQNLAFAAMSTTVSLLLVPV